MYDISQRKQFATVGELREMLKQISDNAQIYICGTSGWYHATKDKDVICLDNEDLDDVYTEDSYEAWDSPESTQWNAQDNLLEEWQ